MGGRVKIKIVDATDLAILANDLAALLHDVVEAGAVVGFVSPFTLTEASLYWKGIAAAVASGERVLFCAFEGQTLVATVQLYLSPEANAPHRGEVYKLLVSRRARGKGIGEALMRATESEALRFGRSLLLLDTVEGGAGERLYRRLGWEEIGRVPNHFVDPSGNPKTSVYFMRHIETGRETQST